MPFSEAAPSASSSSRAPSPAVQSSPQPETNGGRRKSTRTRTQIQRLGASKSKPTPNSDDSASSDDDNQDDDSASDSFSAGKGGGGSDEDEAEFKVPTSTRKGKKTSTTAVKATGGAKRGRKSASGGAAAAGKKKTPAKGRKPRAKKVASSPGGEGDEDEEEEDGEGAGATKKKGVRGKAAASGAGGARQTAKDFKIEDDIGLFNAVASPDTALQQTAEDWLESYKEDSGPAMAELVNFVLRCCGCNATIDEHQAEDENGIVENLKDIVDEFKQESDLNYPLVSKSKPYKKFRSSLCQFLSKLLTLSSNYDDLYSTSFYTHFTSWVYALSSSQIRALRHTATVITLLCVSALSELHVQVKKEHGQAVRAKESEERKGRKDKGRLRDMERQVKEVHERLEQVEGWVDEGYTSVFVNRYRDSDSAIRAECISALGNWMKVDPDLWIDGDYLRYIGWVLSDESKEARRESVKALFSLYQKTSHLGKLHHFTDRFKQQLVDMALGEHNLAVRIQAIHVVCQIDSQGLLTDGQRDEVAKLVFEREKRVRIAASEFWKGLVFEEVEERKGVLEAEGKTKRGRKKGAVGNKGREKEREAERDGWIGMKVLAELLVKYGRELDGPSVAAPERDGEDADNHDHETDDAPPVDLGRPLGEDEDPTQTVPRGRVAFAVEALWDGVDSVREWEPMVAFLLRDHSIAREGSRSPALGRSPVKGNGKGKEKEKEKEGAEGDEEDEEEEAAAEGKEDVPESLKLTEEEETLLLEVLVATLSRAVATARGGGGNKKEREEEDEKLANISRAVIEALPKLFAKHQTLPGRMVDVLSIPRLINLDLYLDMRQVTAYETLWDDVSKQFHKHTSPSVLDQAALTLIHFLTVTNLSATNSSKISELEDSLLSALRTCVFTPSCQNVGDIESASYEEDEVIALEACLGRVEKLSKVRNLTNALEENEGGKEVPAREILEGVVGRGRLGYKNEAKMIEHALNVLGTHLIWQLQSLAIETRQADHVELAALVATTEARQALLDRLEEFAVGNETNAAEGVKQTALTFLLNIYTISRQLTSSAIDPSGHLSDLKHPISDELQARCAGYIEAEIERYADHLAETAAAEAEELDAENAEEEEDEDSGSDTETEESFASLNQSQSQRKKAKEKKGKKQAKGKGKSKKKAHQPKKQEKMKKKTAAQIRAENLKQQTALLAAQRFEETIAPFVRAIHCGAFDLRHSVVLLKHYGRLGNTFDEQAKLLMHDLRDEGNYGSMGNVVAGIVVEALQGSCEIYLEAPESAGTTGEEHLVVLARQLQLVVAVRGAQLAVVSHLPAEDDLKLHLDALKYIIKKIAHFEENKRREERNKALSFFKALAFVTLGMDGRTALKVKTSLDALIDEHKIEMSQSKTWDPIRTYQKRLVTAMAKDPSIAKAADAREKKSKAKSTPKGKGKGRGRKSATTAASDDDDEEEEEEQLEQIEEEEEDEDAQPAAPSPSTSQGRASPVPISQELGVSPQAANGATNESQQEDLRATPRSSRSRGSKRAVPAGDDAEEEEEDGDEFASPRKRQRKSPTNDQLDDEQPQPGGEEEPSFEQDLNLDVDLEGDLGTTQTASQSRPSTQVQAGKKRPRGDDDEREDDAQGIEASVEGDLGPTQTQSAEESARVTSKAKAKKRLVFPADDEEEPQEPEGEAAGPQVEKAVEEGEGEDADEAEEERAAFERAGTADSVMSLTDIKKKKKRARR
ncbi:hypothetical protein JCM11641_002225 [Rhodosporidiobolus odoratus]